MPGWSPPFTPCVAWPQIVNLTHQAWHYAEQERGAKVVMIAANLSEDDLARGEALFRSPASFVKGVVAIDGLPQDGKPELAFAGRSNVGKSSLINALTGRVSLARVSVTPGRTRELNFFALGKGESLYLVDMPGYGYARAAKSEVKGWTRLIRDYLKGRRELTRVFLLIDARHGIKANDREIMTLMDEAAVSYQVVLTKADKPKATDFATVMASVVAELAKHPAAYPTILATSARTGEGIPELRAAVAALAPNAIVP
jgi:GTP-binding protein